jgi:hypothetical protein
MKKLKSTLAIVLAAAMLCALCVTASAAGTILISAQTNSEITVELRIEGQLKNLYHKTVFLPVKAGEDTTAAATVIDLLKYIDGFEGAPEITITQSAYGDYVSAVDGLSEYANAETDGWMFTVNGVAPDVGMSAYPLLDGDVVVLYYSDAYGIGFQIPEPDISKLLTTGLVTFTSRDTTYDEGWNPVTVTNPVVGAGVKWDGADYETNEQGQIAVAKTAGYHELQIEKYDVTTGIPLVLRLAPDYRIFVPFTDMVSGAWYQQAVRFGVDSGFFKGVGNNEFAPTKKMTMAELTQVLYRIADEPEITATPWYAPAYDWAVENGLYPSDLFVPTISVTREEFIYLFFKTVTLIGEDDVSLRVDIKEATDYDAITTGYRDALSWSVAAGLIQGVDEGALTIKPKSDITRAEVCQMLLRYFW